MISSLGPTLCPYSLQNTSKKPPLARKIPSKKSNTPKKTTTHLTINNGAIPLKAQISGRILSDVFKILTISQDSS
jgi:hypothetical protein